MKKIFLTLSLILGCIIVFLVGLYIEEKTILTCYGKIDDGIYDKNDVKQITYKLGNYKGTVAFYVEDRISSQSKTDEDFFIFNYEKGYRIYFYKDNKIYSLDEAYDEKIIDRIDVKRIQLKYSEYLNIKYILLGDDYYEK